MALSLILAILTGLSFLVGIIVLKNVKHKEKMLNFTMSLAFVVLLGLLLFDLLDELLEFNNILLIIPLILGFIIFILLDKLIPHHSHEHTKNKTVKEEHLEHIGIITMVALVIHNLIEGVTLYTIALNEPLSGVLMAISISLHNIPLGFQIGNLINNKSNNKFLIILLCLSSFIGAIFIMIFGSLNEFIISILIALTFGMLLYILIFELYGEIKNSLKKKETGYGIIVGIIVLFITYLIKWI